MKNNLIKYEKKFKLIMSNKDEFVLSENEMKRLETQIVEWGIFKKEDWTLINPSFFVIAEPFDLIEWITDQESKMLNDKEKQAWKATKKLRLEWLTKYRKWGLWALYW